MLHRNIRSHPQATGISNERVPASEGQSLQDVYPPDRAFGGPGYFPFDPLAHLREDSPPATPENARRTLRRWGAWMDLGQGRLLLEKSPSNLLRGRFLQRLVPGSHFPFVTRHPVVVSLATRKWAGSPLPRLLEHWARAHDILGGDLPRIGHADRALRGPGGERPRPPGRDRRLRGPARRAVAGGLRRS